MKQELKIIEQREILGKEFKLYGTIEEPLFLAKDIANWIEHNKPSEMAQMVDEDEKLKAIISLAGQKREVVMLTEDGLYEILMQSRKLMAKQFKKKVKEILKEIRKDGMYVTDEAELNEVLPLKEEVILVYHNKHKRFQLFK